MECGVLEPRSAAKPANLEDKVKEFLDISKNAALIDDIKAASQHRKTLVRARTNLTLQIKAKARDIARAQIHETGEITFSKTLVATSAEDIAAAEAAYPALKAALDILKPPIAALEREIKKLVRGLPVWDWAAGVRGIGEISVGTIVAEAGDLSNYRNEAAIWKRFGLGLVVDAEGKTVRQRRSTDAQLAQLMGYSPHRRAVMHTIGEVMIKLGGAYAEFYREQKTKIAERHPELTKMHIHRRAMRKMEKKFLSDFYHAWQLCAE